MISSQEAIAEWRYYRPLVLPQESGFFSTYRQISGTQNQRKGKGGRPAIIANSKKSTVENLTNSLISIPWGVEAVWAVLTPTNVTSEIKIQKIVVGSIYCKPDSRKKSA